MAKKQTRKKFAAEVAGVGTLRPVARPYPTIPKQPAAADLLQLCEHCARFFFGPADRRFCSQDCARDGADPRLRQRIELFRADRQAIRKSLAIALVEGWELVWAVDSYALALRALTGGVGKGPLRTRRVFECTDVATAVRVLAAIGDRILARDLYNQLAVSKSWRLHGEAALPLRVLAGLAAGG